MITIKSNKENTTRINEEITGYNECRLINEEGNDLGIFTVEEALEQAYELGYDLIEMSASSNPPVCKMLDYNKFIYDKKKRQKENRKNAKTLQVKEMKFRCGIGDNDYNTKKKHILRFLESGHKVKITIMFRGREINHTSIGLNILERLSTDLEDKVNVVSHPTLDGKNMSMVIEPRK